MQINKITTRYNKKLNCIYLNTESAEQKIHTFRILRPLVKAFVLEIVNKLDYKVRRKMASDIVSGIHLMRQLIAQSALNATKPVRSHQEQIFTPILIHTIAIKESSHGYVFILKSEGQEDAYLMMNELQVRRWLSVIRRISVKAGWNQNIWPKWIIEEEWVLENTKQGQYNH